MYPLWRLGESEALSPAKIARHVIDRTGCILVSFGLLRRMGQEDFVKLVSCPLPETVAGSRRLHAVKLLPHCSVVIAILVEVRHRASTATALTLRIPTGSGTSPERARAP